MQLLYGTGNCDVFAQALGVGRDLGSRMRTCGNAPARF